jgi:hypothetical protein
MTHLHKKYFFIAMSIGIALSGCKKGYLDVNTDPNRVTDASVTPELIFPAGAEEAGSAVAGTRAFQAGAKADMFFLEAWIGYMASNGDFAIDPTETSYNIDFNFNDVQWQRRYHYLFDLHNAEIKGLPAGDTILAGAAIVLEAKMWQDLVDLFGDIPYSQAFQAATITTPKYDKASDIYANLLLRLDTAKMYLSKTVTASFQDGVDIVFHGKTKGSPSLQGAANLWIQFANTMKLRLLIRQSQIAGFSPSTEIGKIFGAGNAGILGAGQSAGENPGYTNDVNKQNPFYAEYGYTPTGVKAITSSNANLYIVNILKNSNDPRIGRFFDTVSTGAYVGDKYGDQAGNIPSGNNSSYFGPGIVGSAAQDQWLIPSYESLFFYAEAVARGWVAGNTDSAYVAAVRESFVWIGVPDGINAANKYMADNPGIASWGSFSDSTVSKQVNFIAYQKYIANTCVDAQESYEDQNRLHFLTDNSYISINPSKVLSQLPTRVLYPQSEYTTNAANVPTGISTSSKIFWEP